MNASLIDGFVLMLIGMVTVSIFLTLLVGLMHLSRIIISRFEQARVTIEAPEPSPQQVAAISAAVFQFRQDQENKR